MRCFSALNHLHCYSRALPVEIASFGMLNKRKKGGEGQVARSLSENACYGYLSKQSCS